ncbi:hypothetical protein B0T22DRAFT_254531 [Podospora appendiculata]|uniref:Uncharacterized protein n=1 Tax=Podospora appendiculata TaxID=314037 RepID=A0AAE0X2Q7_9PEZI|nr:hypothetical protein B0T22DRAFT_254531 [Podospora appendiculata]
MQDMDGPRQVRVCSAVPEVGWDERHWSPVVGARSPMKCKIVRHPSDLLFLQLFSHSGDNWVGGGVVEARRGKRKMGKGERLSEVRQDDVVATLSGRCKETRDESLRGCLARPRAVLSWNFKVRLLPVKQGKRHRPDQNAIARPNLSRGLECEKREKSTDMCPSSRRSHGNRHCQGERGAMGGLESYPGEANRINFRSSIDSRS